MLFLRLNFLCFFLLFFITIRSFSQYQNAETIFSDVIDKKIDTLVNFLEEKQIDSVFIRISNEKISEYILNKIVQKANLFFLKKARKEDTNLPILSLFSKLNVEYKVLKDNYLERIIEVDISGFLENNNSIIPIKLNKEVIKDTVTYEFVENEQSSGIFPKGNLPEKSKSFFEEYIEPIVFITSGLITVIVLFTIRSK